MYFSISFFGWLNNHFSSSGFRRRDIRDGQRSCLASMTARNLEQLKRAVSESHHPAASSISAPCSKMTHTMCSECAPSWCTNSPIIRYQSLLNGFIVFFPWTRVCLTLAIILQKNWWNNVLRILSQTRQMHYRVNSKEVSMKGKSITKSGVIRGLSQNETMQLSQLLTPIQKQRINEGDSVLVKTEYIVDSWQEFWIGQGHDDE